MDRRSLYQVNEESNKRWYRRLQIVDEMAAWVFDNLDRKKRPQREPKARRQAKAYQYVYEHLAAGKLFHPMEDEDPLFTYNAITDESMINMLNPGLYPDFQVMVRRLITEFQEYNPNCMMPIKMQDVDKKLGPAARDTLASLQAQLKDDYKKLSSKWYEDQLIGLVIRYDCIGGFSDNLHASVPDTWARELPDFIESFASQFNHKFDTYFSVFKEDKLFWSNGSFFAMIEANGGILPSGKYEINPPWNNHMYEELVEILDRSMPMNDIQAIIIGPNWKDASWCKEGFNNLITKYPEYTGNSFKNVNVIPYVNDTQKKPLPLETAYWVISKTPMKASVLAKLNLFNPKSHE